MMRLGGLRFALARADRLSAAERSALGRFGAEADADAPFGFELELRDGPPRASLGPSDDDSPAAVDWSEDRVLIGHRRLEAALDPASATGWLRRDASVAWPLEVTLRTALATGLPLAGGLPLHAAGLVIGGRGVAFFGPSGAGKSTLAAHAARPVLSDEMVAVLPHPAGREASPRRYVLTGTGFWGANGPGDAPAGLHPLAAIVELERAAVLRVERLDPKAALRRLIVSTLVPPGPPLWSAALAVIGRLVREVPVLRLAWTPSRQPWSAVETAIESTWTAHRGGARALA